MEIRFTDPVNDFANGIRVLRTYHDDFIVRGEQLLRLTEAIYKNGMTGSFATRCIEIHSYYTRANKLHHQDEEVALFPAIVNQSFLLDGMIERLTLDHEEIEETWDELAVMLGNPEQLTGVGKLKRIASEFEKKQREHLVRENEDFLAHVEKILGQEQLVTLGKKMAALRGLNNNGELRLAI